MRLRLSLRLPRLPVRSLAIRWFAALVVGVAAAVGPAAALAQTTRTVLGTGWQVRLAPSDPHAAAHPQATAWLPAAVPGVVQTDLMAAGLMPDPWAGDNESAVQWVGLSDWQYRLRFEVDRATLARDHVDLVFDGLDTFAVVRLNGVELLKADNMYRSWRVPAKALLRASDNELEVDVASPIKAMQPQVLGAPWSLPGSYDSAFGDEPKGRQTAGYVRKAGYQYGWDWAPRIVTLGVWRPVALEASGSVKLDDVHVAQDQLDDGLALLRAQFDLRADRPQRVTLQVDLTAPDGKVRRATRQVDLAAGDNHVAVPVQVDKPQRWWPVGYGKQALYTAEARVLQGGRTVGTSTRRIGLRTVELRRQPDPWGRGFALVVNGVPVFAKGANLVPFDSFPSRVTAPQMHAVLDAAVEANMNIVRVWGGGVYPDDAFYEHADAIGLMVWQDFMFGGALPPDSAAFRESTRLEAVEQVRRLRNHPSVVLWCGGNEVLVSWEKWADRLKFKAAIDAADRERIAVGMAVLFGQTLRTAVSDNAPGTPYVASSPSTDYDGPADQMGDGDNHFWDVWIDKPVEDYLTTTPRFMSEFGLQSVPSLPTVAAFMAPRPIDAIPVQLTDSGYDNGAGNGRVLRYIRASYGEPASFADYVYLSQVLQAEGLEMAVLNMRSSRPRGMGTLYWTLNDAWPGQINALWAGAAWGSVDWHVRWKAAHHRARRFYAPVVASALRRGSVTEATVTSDRQQPFTATWRLRVVDVDGRLRSERGGRAITAPLAATPVGHWTDAELLGSADPHRTVAVLDVFEGGRRLSRSTAYFAKAKELALPDPHLQAQLASAPNGGATLTVTAGAFARAVWIDFGALDASLSDNAFDLAAGETATVAVTSRVALDRLKQALTVRSLYGAARPLAAAADR